MKQYRSENREKLRVPFLRTPHKNGHEKWTTDSTSHQRFIGLYDHNSYSGEESDDENKIHSRVMSGTQISYQPRAYTRSPVRSNFTWSMHSLYISIGNFLTAIKNCFLRTYNSIKNAGFVQLPQSYTEPEGSSVSFSFLPTEKQNWFYQHYQAVPKTLLWILMISFLSLTISCSFLIKNRSSPSQSRNKFPICQPMGISNEKCVKKHALPAALKLLKAIQPLVEERSRKYACESLYGDVSPEAQPLMRSDLLVYLKVKHQNHIPNSILNMETLITANPHWGIVLKEVDQNIVYVSSPLTTPIMCYMKYSLHWLVKLVTKTAISAVLVVGVLKLVSVYNAYAQDNKQKLNGMVARIRNVLKEEYDRNQKQPFVIVIDHVRDQLIPQKDRKRLGVLWSSAVNYIRQNDAHIKEEKTVINGELKTVWHWISQSGTSSPGVSAVPENSTQAYVSTASDGVEIRENTQEATLQQSESEDFNYRSSGIWQSEASETMAGSPNSVPCSPTPCLKIRHMFDPDVKHGDFWPNSIRDAILEKCEGVSVLHLYVDKTSPEGCVYLKFRTSGDATRAYRALHGWWFGNSHLVTAKYMRVERYYERFPEAVNARFPLQPSRKSKLLVTK